MPETHEDTTLQIIELVDNNFEKRLRKVYFSRKTSFNYYLPFIAIGFYLTLFFFACYLLSLVAKALPIISDQTPSAQVAIAISITAAFLALSSFAVNLQKVVNPLNPNEILLDYNYRVLKGQISEDNLALLKGLIILKSKHPELSLKQILEPSITKDKLFEILCR